MASRHRARLLRLASASARDGGRTGGAMTADAARGVIVQRTCPRCGTESAGAPWCPKCGLNLRVKSEPAAASAVASAPGPVAALERTSRHRPSAVLLGIVAVVVAIAGATVAIVLATSGSGTKASVVTQLTVVRTVPVATPTIAAATTPAPAAAGVVTVADIEDTLNQYADAYSSEDVGSLASLFAADLVRRNGTDPPENRAQALATYQRQFDGLTNPDYRLTNVQFERGVGEGAAVGTYVIVHAAGSTSGRIYFHFVASDGRLLIDDIEIKPSQ